MPEQGTKSYLHWRREVILTFQAKTPCSRKIEQFGTLTIAHWYDICTLKGHYLHLLATVITAKTNLQRLNGISSVNTANLCTILSAAPGVDVPTLSQDHYMVVSTWNLMDQPLVKKLQKHWLQNLHAELTLHSNAAIIVWPKHVHLVLICKSGSSRKVYKVCLQKRVFCTSNSRKFSSPTSDAGGEVSPACHLSDGLPL